MLRIFNTLTSKKEYFKSIIEKKINFYVCGVTVYDFCHIGHGRTFVAFDMIVRYLRYSGFQVNYIRNITDIDDKIILKSIKENTDINFLTDLMINEMHKDFFELGILPPNEEPRITDYIDSIILMIKVLIKKKHAYINKYGDVIFSIDTCDDYGILSRQSLNALKAGSRVSIDSSKKNPLDFVLWKKSITEHYSWNSPWGKGRPGWHIECSTITKIFFKNAVDIHGGGSDLIFPHHENERSQSMCLDKHAKINFWMHTGMVVIKNQKMSKSLGNSYLLRDILKNYNSEVLRYYFLSTHYRHPIYYCNKNIIQAQRSLTYLYLSLYNTDPLSNTEEGLSFESAFQIAMNDDFNTPKALSILMKIANQINYFKSIDTLKSNKLSFRLQALAKKIGLLSQKPEHFLQKKNTIHDTQIKKIEYLIDKRNTARKLRLWKEADNIRRKLMSLNIILEDFHDKTIWRKK